MTLQLSLSDEEQEFLAKMLSRELREKRVQEHRADSLDFKHVVAHQEELIEGLLNKLGRLAVSGI
jgi:hypothetical protein